MKYIIKTCTLLLIIAAGLMLVPSLSGNAKAQQCGVEICKVAPQLPIGDLDGEAVFFTFDLQQGSDSESIELAANGRCIDLGFDEGADLQLVEEPLAGWRLSDIECKSADGISTTLIENGIVFSCNTQTETFINCNFVNLAEAAVPTLSEWGMISAAAGLGLIGVFFAMRRRLQAGA